MYKWELDKGDESLAIAVNGSLLLDELDLVIQAAVDGAGLTWDAEDRITEHLASGALVRVLEDWCPPFPGFFLYYPSRRQRPAALSALIDTLRLEESEPRSDSNTFEVLHNLRDRFVGAIERSIRHAWKAKRASDTAVQLLHGSRYLSDHDGYRGCIVTQMPAGKSRDLVEQAAQHAVSIRRAMSNNRFQKAIVAELEAL